MPVMRSPCMLPIFAGYLAFLIAGIVLELALRQRTQGIPRPLTQAALQTAEARRLFRWNRFWRWSNIPVWIGVVLLLSTLCPKLHT